MKLLAKCPECTHSLSLDADMADKRVRCPQCNRMFKVPDMENLDKAVNIIRKAKSQIHVDQDGKIYG